MEFLLVVLIILLAVGLFWLWADRASYKLEKDRALNDYKAELDRQFNEYVLEKDRALDAHKAKWDRSIRDDAAKRSQATTIGKMTEHLAPYLPDFVWNPKDTRFLGSPIDLVVFDGLSEGEVKNVVFVEVKTGKSSNLTTRERRVRDAIEDRRVTWELLKISRF